jgi:tetratricopeptide (TPR) repeat protein
VRYNLGNLLWNKGEKDEGETQLRTAIQLAPSAPASADYYVSLALALFTKGDNEGGEVVARAALWLDPKNPRAHITLGLYLDARGKRAEAEALLRKAVQLHPNNGQVHGALGTVLANKGDFDEAITHFRAALRMEPGNPVVLDALPRAERNRELLRRLPDVLAGKSPATPAQKCEFAGLCGRPVVGRYAAAVRLYEEAFAADPKLADDLAVAHRYNSTCYAGRAAHGDGTDAPTDPMAKAALRAKAFNWLRMDLNLCKRQAASQDGAARNMAAVFLARMLMDADLASLRPGMARMDMPARERAEWDALWADIKATSANLRQPPRSPKAEY